jgi:hypothetical protein
MSQMLRSKSPTKAMKLPKEKMISKSDDSEMESYAYNRSSTPKHILRPKSRTGRSKNLLESDSEDHRKKSDADSISSHDKTGNFFLFLFVNATPSIENCNDN